MEFPKFDGTNPQLWRDCCEMYYEVYVVLIINHEDAFHRFEELSCPCSYLVSNSGASRALPGLRGNGHEYKNDFF